MNPPYQKRWPYTVRFNRKVLLYELDRFRLAQAGDGIVDFLGDLWPKSIIYHPDGTRTPPEGEPLFEKIADLIPESLVHGLTEDGGVRRLRNKIGPKSGYIDVNTYYHFGPDDWSKKYGNTGGVGHSDRPWVGRLG
jgi:hypothetical protein